MYQKTTTVKVDNCITAFNNINKHDYWQLGLNFQNASSSPTSPKNQLNLPKIIKNQWNIKIPKSPEPKIIGNSLKTSKPSHAYYGKPTRNVNNDMESCASFRVRKINLKKHTP